ncbi:enoyl-CoA hydratase/isomerase family protein [Paraburkholderia susongensis]|uniref:Enoyl-CoA hydratase/carnithine racemase n=1 Tax=Paraburkholderia susongensis TaxID=1515439 RepID=A0A1X7M0N1_9BURK|nr:enoyl-CoA hydratase/isomerase family protein [Paraburkholderia susongensis]SMG59062.1 Enoyl-CoA hydratase/carnithine racemase [Paraburkholderia susongensis]
MGQILSRREGAVLTLELSNPGKANALDFAMLAALDEQIARIGEDDTIRAVVLRGTAGGVFSSGADIREWSTLDPQAFATQWIGEGNAVFRRFERLRCPTVAVIEGLCFGGGLELALCCDLRLAGTGARLRFPEVAIGAIPGWEGGDRLQRIAGRGRALEAVLLSREIDPPAALQWGIVNAVCAPQEVEARLEEWTARLCRISPRAAALAKALIVDDDKDPHAAYPAAALAVRSSPDAELGIRAFFAKTAAVF